MASAVRDPTMTRYVQHLISDMKGRGMSGADIAKAFGLSQPGHVSQLFSGKVGVGGKNVARIAAFYGKSPSELMADAEHWCAENPEGAPPPPEDWPERTQAIAAVKAIRPETTSAELAPILAAYGAEFFRRRTRGWWVETLLRELHGGYEAEPPPPPASVARGTGKDEKPKKKRRATGRHERALSG